ncbi:MAG: hypothetical protein WAT92_20465 [Saprospiraceae bacterium]
MNIWRGWWYKIKKECIVRYFGLSVKNRRSISKDAITNIVKHSNADYIHSRFTCKSTLTQLIISDNANYVLTGKSDPLG